MRYFVDKHDFAHDPVQKINVMADNQYRTFVIFKIIGNIIPGCRIQMVGRLVQTQNFRFGIKYPGKRQLRLLTAGKFGQPPVQQIGIDFHFFHQREQNVIGLILVKIIQLFLQISHTLKQPLMFGFRRGFQPPVNFFQFGFDFLQRTAGGEILPHRFVFTVKNNFLRQIADPRPADGQSTAVKRNLAAQQPEKRGLAGAVDADDSRLVPVTELKLGIVKDDLRPERQIHPAALHYFLLLFYGNKKTRFMPRFFELVELRRIELPT